MSLSNSALKRRCTLKISLTILPASKTKWHRVCSDTRLYLPVSDKLSLPARYQVHAAHRVKKKLFKTNMYRKQDVRKHYRFPIVIVF